MYGALTRSWVALSKAYPGWSLEEIQSLSPRERLNYIQLAIEMNGGMHSGRS